MTVGYNAEPTTGIDTMCTSRRSVRTQPRSTAATKADLAAGGNPS
jgi:hypothetical protein